MTQLELVTYSYNDLPVFFQTDGYLNATQIVKQFGKIPNEFLRLKSTKEYIKDLKDETLRGKTETKNNVEIQYVITRNGGLLAEQGTWIHPDLAVIFARWLNSKFGVWCDRQIKKLMETGTVSIQPQTPTDYLEALEALVASEKEKRLALANQAKAERAVVKLNTIIDNDFGHSSILRAAKFLGIKETIFSWRVLKETTLGLDLEVKRVPSPRYGYQNLYPIRAFQLAYPEYDFNDLKPESHEDKLELAFIK